MAKVIRFALLTGLSLALGLGLFTAGVAVGRVSAGLGAPASAFAPLSGAAPAGGAPPDLSADFAPFWEAWSLVHEEYVDQPVDDQKLIYGAISGMMQALGDPHTGYSTPSESDVLLSDFAGELEGIGAEVAAKGDYVEIISPLPGSPAEAAGILPGDLIIAVDGENTAGQDLFTVISKVRGPAGTRVTLTIQRADEPEPLEFEITRARIEIRSVESKLLEGGVGYVKINSFGDKTAAELKAQLKDLLAENPSGLVLDLRGNPGGSRDAAIDVVSQFVGEGVVMIQRFGDGREVEFIAEAGGLATKIPLVVLINKGSASASEIVAAAIQDYGRGQIVGEQSYGKGTVQDWRMLSGDNGSVRITIARWLSPEGRTVDKVGITPDVPVALTKEDRAAKRDPQLDAAVALLADGAG